MSASSMKYLMKRQQTPSLIAKKTELKPVFNVSQYRQVVSFAANKRFTIHPKGIKHILPAIEDTSKSEMMGSTKNTIVN